MTEKEQEQGFYDKLDFYKRSKSSCGCLGFALIIMSILVVGEILLFVLARNIKVDNLSTGTPPAQLSDAEYSRVEGKGSVEVVVSEGMLCSKIKDVRSLDQANIRCEISDDKFTVSGKIASFLPANAKAEFFPSVEDGKVISNLNKLAVGNIAVPSWVALTLKPTINEALKVGSGSVSRIDLGEGVMVLIVDQKDNNEDKPNS